MWGRIVGLEHGRKGAKGVGEAGEKRNRGKRNSWKLLNPYLIFRNRKIAKGKKLRKKGRKPDMQGTGDGRFGPPVTFPRT